MGKGARGLRFVSGIVGLLTLLLAFSAAINANMTIAEASTLFLLFALTFMVSIYMVTKG